MRERMPRDALKSSAAVQTATAAQFFQDCFATARAGVPEVREPWFEQGGIEGVKAASRAVVSPAAVKRPRALCPPNPLSASVA